MTKISAMHYGRLTHVAFRVILLGVVFILLPVTTATGDASHGRTAHLPALRLSYANLSEIMRKLQNLTDIMQSKPGADRSKEELTISDDDTKLILSGDYSLQALQRGPSVATDLEFVLYDFREGAAISLIRIEFSDFRREITVEGTSPERVEALSSTLIDDFSRHRTVFGGVIPRVLVGILAAAFFILLSHRVSSHLRNPLLRNIFVPVLGGVGAGLIIIVSMLGGKLWMPGFALLSGETSLLARYAPQISFIGLIVGILALIPRFGIIWSRQSQGMTDQNNRERP
jgi:hypothetical protein